MTDWEEPATSGFGGGFGRGAGRGGSMVDKKLRGFGRGRPKDTFDSVDSGSSSTNGGFGGGFGRGTGSSGGFASKPGSSGGFGGGFGGSNSGGFGTTNGGGGDDEWDETPSNGFAGNSVSSTFASSSFGGGGSGGGGSGFGGGGGGFGSGGGGFGGGGGGFGGGGGGFGGGGDRKQGGSRACFKCGEEGHMSRECPSAGSGGGGGSRACFKCGEEGHMSRECPSAGSGGGGGSRACFKCGEEGHMSRECPSAGSSGGGGGRGCFKCGEEGHMSRECPNSEAGGGGGGGGGKGCYNCGQDGHISRECPNKEVDPNKPAASTYVPPPPPEDEAGIFQQDVVKGINFDKYDDIPVECTGNDKPSKGIGSFEEAGLNAVCLDNVQKAKYTKPTPIQRWAMPCIIKGRDIMACAQTGSGKTAAFLLPIITGMIQNGIEGSAFDEVQSPQCVIVGPTRELVLQIRDQARKFCYNTMVRSVVVYGGTSVMSQLREVSKGCHLVVGTPGRLLDFIEKGKISLAKVKYLVLDEADRMLDMGFAPAIKKLVTQLGMPEKTERQTLMFSATFPSDVQNMAADFLNDYLFITIGRVGGANTDITQTIHKVTRAEKRERLVAILNEQDSLDRTLIFVEQKRAADFLASFLSQSNFPTTSIHGDRLQNEREEALRDFKSGRAPVLVATSVAARGLDINDVKHVINFDLPSGIDEYVHRIGRTGRCGNLGRATSFYDSENNRDLARSLIKVLSQAEQEVPDWLEEEGQDTYGTGFGAGVGGKFGGTDTRKQNFTQNDGDWGNGSGGGVGGGFSGGFGGGASTAAVDDESWD